MKSQRILIVEDERIVALNLQQRLIKLGYDVVARAASGDEALARARELLPDLVLMDIHIEGAIDGIDTAARLIEELRLRVIYLTAYSEDTTLECVIRAKPVHDSAACRSSIPREVGPRFRRMPVQ